MNFVSGDKGFAKKSQPGVAVFPDLNSFIETTFPAEKEEKEILESLIELLDKELSGKSRPINFTHAFQDGIDGRDATPLPEEQEARILELESIKSLRIDRDTEAAYHGKNAYSVGMRLQASCLVERVVQYSDLTSDCHFQNPRNENLWECEGVMEFDITCTLGIVLDDQDRQNLIEKSLKLESLEICLEEVLTIEFAEEDEVEA